MRAPRHISKILWGALGLALVGCLWFWFAPAAIGGSTSYVVTDGVSMEPRFHGGDLAVVRGESDYRVGQIVAYDNHQLGTVVLHRIIGREGARYIFKGDNNNFTDFEHPARSQLIGALWLHLPGAGKTLDSIRSPALIGLLVAIGTLLIGGASFAKRRRRRRRERAGGGPVPAAAARPGAKAARERLAPGPAAAILAFAMVAMTPFFVLAVLAFTRPAAEVLAVNVPYRQSGRLGYSATTAPGPTYPSGSVRTGEPLFTHVVRAVDFAFAYRFSSAASHRLEARGGLTATLSSTAGWHTTIPLAPPVALRGDSGVLRARLDLPTLFALIGRVESDTAVRGSYTLTVLPRVRLGGELAGAPLHGVFAPASKFSLNRLEIRPVAANGSASEAAQAPTSFAHAEAASVTARRVRPAHIALGPVSLPVATARAIALGGLAIITCALVAALVLARPRRRSRTAAILSRYGSMIVPVERVWQQPGVAVIDVADIDSLARIADHYERSILHERTEYGDAFWVSDESGQFRYAVVDPVHEPEPSPGAENGWEPAAAYVPDGTAEAEPAFAPAPAWGGEAANSPDQAWEGEAAFAPEPAWETNVHDDPNAGFAPPEPAGLTPEPEAWVGEPEQDHEPAARGWAPAPGPAAAPAEAGAAAAATPEDVAADDLRPALPDETLKFGAFPRSALARR
jgi:signal peptidase I